MGKGREGKGSKGILGSGTKHLTLKPETEVNLRWAIRPRKERLRLEAENFKSLADLHCLSCSKPDGREGIKVLNIIFFIK